MVNNIFFSPSGIVQVENESFVPKLGKNLIVVSVHVACNKSQMCSDCERSAACMNSGITWWSEVPVRKSKMDMSMMLRSLLPEL